MNGNSDRPTIVIGVRELIMGVGALVVIGFIIFAVVFVVRALPANRAARATLTPDQDTPAPTAQPSPTPTPLSLGAPTSVPAGPTATLTPASFEHEVQSGETLSSIATLYGLNLQTLLQANNLTLDSVIQQGQTLTIPIPPSQAGTWHQVAPGETLTIIANRYDVTVDALRRANGLTEESVIFSGQRLRIPGVSGAPTPTLAPTSEATTAAGSPDAYTVDDLPERPVRSEWSRSILEGALADNYPLTFSRDNFTVHYQEGTYAGQNLGQTMGLVDDALGRIQRTLDVSFDEEVDVYVGGTLFASPNAHLRGVSATSEGRVFVLHDGTGTPADNAYFFTHELTHFVSRKAWGSPGAAFILSEGLATYAGRRVLTEGGYMDIRDICAALYAADALPSLTAIETDWQAFLGHIREPFNYFSSGCFVGYLIDTYGLEAMQELYTTSDYEAVTGRSLAWLSTEWESTLEERVLYLKVDPVTYVDRSRELSEAFQFIFNNYDGTDTLYNAYLAADQARVALWKGDLDEARRWLAAVYDILGYVP